jgi:RNA polymerase-binding transcription factor DksA
MALTKTERQRLEQRLLAERERVVSSLARYAREQRDTVQEAAGDVSTYRIHPADRGTDTADQELDASNAARQTTELTEIDAALERLYKRPEQYGVCEVGGESIPFERLDLLPWTRTCATHSR